ncbi:MAG TPA: glycosyltransferase family 87 protein [Candidatus Omnitrophota bacterium]|nr:glycosyltransferase family 87 protein [Candidatus Omnitrophota bacterium]HQB94532.1 glycosyltransferase family 87 protein [Candidatus Omnitrophota bacterium]
MLIFQRIIGFFLRKKWLGWLLVFALFYGTCISTVYRGAIGHKQRTDLTVYIKAAEMVRIGNPGHIYGIETDRHWHYVYSPFLAVTLAPVSHLPFVILVIANYLLALACLFATLFLSRTFTSEGPEATWKIIFAAILCLPVILNTLTRGQLGTVMLFFQAIVLFCYMRNLKVLAGVLLALAVSLKTSPLAALLFFFLFQKEWKVLLAAAAGFAVFLILYPSLSIGFRTNWNLLMIWKGLMAEGSSIQAYKNYLWPELFTPFAGDNQSFYAVLIRLVWRSDSDFIAHPSNWVRWISMAAGAVAMALIFLKRSRPDRRAVSPEKLMAEFSLYPAWMLVFSPVTQIHHYTSLYFLFLAALFLSGKENPRSRFLTVGRAFSAVLFLLGLIIDPLAYLGLPMWGTLALGGIVLFCLDGKQDGHAGRAQSPGP